MKLTILATIATCLSLVAANPGPPCAACNPVAGKNWCDESTSCINVGHHYYCACRAGYKAEPGSGGGYNQFRLDVEGVRQYVFVPPGTKCDTLCDNCPGLLPTESCAEVGFNWACPV